LSAAPSRSIKIAVFSLLVLIWGTTWFVVKIGVEAYPPFFSITARFLLAGGLFLILLRVRRIPIPRDPELHVLFLVVGILSYTMSYGVVYWGEQYVSSGLAAVVFSLFPIFTGILAHRFLDHEKIGPLRLAGLLVSLAGIVVINLSDLSQFHPRAPLAALLMVISPAASAVAAIMSKRRVQEIHPFVFSAVPMIYAGLINLVIYLLFERHIRIEWSTTGTLTIVYLATFGTMVTFGFYFWLLRHMEVGKIALIAYLTPIVALAVGTYLGGETVTPAILGGTALVLAGVGVTSRAK